ncbi:MarR family winged helix-turn-helix transcriptional regulator [Shinella pollutisoli]|uniref:MarR family winged helix-turn-helix transcriptional regulator n=1 Tax=Shinella pollutisoli TaxID=2250594 RepID=A0ABV7DMF2_9HYPH|nr:MarR family transcriptional regulator [Shinella pollutisoli]
MPVPPSALEAARLIDRIERLSRGGVPVHGLNPAQWDALRYLSRANRFSRTPAGLAAYLGSTRGTVSQTLIALEEKGFVHKRASERDRRSVDLGLTEKGTAALGDDPLLLLARDVAEATGDEASTVVALLQQTLRAAIRRNGGRAFGLCRTCRYFRAGNDPASGEPHHCTLLNEPLSEADSGGICLEQEDA